MRTVEASETRERSPAAKASRDHPDWATLLANAANTPGVISQAYSRFWNYSVGNQLLAWFQCLQGGIELGTIHTFKGWLDLGRHVKRGEKGDHPLHAGHGQAENAIIESPTIRCRPCYRFGWGMAPNANSPAPAGSCPMPMARFPSRS